MLLKWRKRRGSEATYQALLEIFQQANNEMLIDLLLKYAENGHSTHSLESVNLKFPKVSNKHDIPELEKKHSEIKEQFAFLSLQIIKSLEKTQRPKHLAYYVTKASRFQFESTDDITDIIAKISSWFNIKVLKILVNRFGNDDNKESLLHYEQDLLTYLQQSLFNIPAESFQSCNETSDVTMCYLKIPDQDVNMLYLSGEDVLQIERNLADYLGIPHEAFNLCQYRLGCIELVFSIPTTLYMSLQKHVVLDRIKNEFRLTVDLQDILPSHLAKLYIPKLKPSVLTEESHVGSEETVENTIYLAMEDEGQQKKPNTCSITLTGKTGSGKSSLVNNLLPECVRNDDQFEDTDSYFGSESDIQTDSDDDETYSSHKVKTTSTNHVKETADSLIRPKTHISLFMHKGLSSFIKTSLKVGIVGLLASIVLYFLVSGIISVFTKSNGTGALTPKDAVNLLEECLSSFVKTSQKVGIVGLLASIVLYFLVSGIISVFTKSNGTGALTPKNAVNLLEEYEFPINSKWENLARNISLDERLWLKKQATIAGDCERPVTCHIPKCYISKVESVKMTTARNMWELHFPVTFGKHKHYSRSLIIFSVAMEDKGQQKQSSACNVVLIVKTGSSKSSLINVLLPECVRYEDEFENTDSYFGSKTYSSHKVKTTSTSPEVNVNKEIADSPIRLKILETCLCNLGISLRLDEAICNPKKTCQGKTLVEILNENVNKILQTCQEKTEMEILIEFAMGVADFLIERPELFSRKLDFLSHIRHPNLLQFMRTTRVGNPMILTELMPKGVHKELEKRLMTHCEIITIAGDVASPLSYLHFGPILHRDISSANVLLEPSSTSRWKAKISDFGTANVQLISSVLPGNVTYMAPETLSPCLSSRENVMDIYTFGVAHLEIATQYLPLLELIKNKQEFYIKSLIDRCITHGEGFGGANVGTREDVPIGKKEKVVVGIRGLVSDDITGSVPVGTRGAIVGITGDVPMNAKSLYVPITF